MSIFTVVDYHRQTGTYELFLLRRSIIFCWRPSSANSFLPCNFSSGRFNSGSSVTYRLGYQLVIKDKVIGFLSKGRVFSNFFKEARDHVINAAGHHVRHGGNQQRNGVFRRESVSIC
jgi:hypothetical protein